MPVSHIKAEPKRACRQSRLSVQPVRQEWNLVCAMGGVKAYASRRLVNAWRASI
jgi:predicted RNA-binding protein with PUA-like domain